MNILKLLADAVTEAGKSPEQKAADRAAAAAASWEFVDEAEFQKSFKEKATPAGEQRRKSFKETMDEINRKFAEARAASAKKLAEDIEQINREYRERMRKINKNISRLKKIVIAICIVRIAVILFA